MVLGVDGTAGGSSSGAILYTATVIYGLFVSQLYASSTCLCNTFTNLGLSYVFINNLGSSIGTMIGPTITGQLFNKLNPKAFFQENTLKIRRFHSLGHVSSSARAVLSLKRLSISKDFGSWRIFLISLLSRNGLSLIIENLWFFMMLLFNQLKS